MTKSIFRKASAFFLILFASVSFASFESAAQNVNVTGVVVDVNDLPLIGVSIIEKGTMNGIVTDNDGKFSLRTTGKNAVLEFSYLGYVSQEIKVGSQSNLKVVLEEDFLFLDELVVVGYGTQSKGTLTSSVSVVKSDDVVRNTVANVTNTLSGLVPGLISRSSSGEPGKDDATLYVRGISTTGNNGALIVIDGIPDRSLSSVDINDIESVSVLKDASAVAPYGSRGANGVILVTTKKGQSIEGTKPTIRYTTYYGIEKPTKYPDFCSAADYARMFNEASLNEGKAPAFSEEEIAKYAAGTDPNYPNTDWWKAILMRNPIQSQHNLSVSGQSEKMNYYLSIGAYRQDGYFEDSDYRRYNFRSNIDANITRDFKVSFSVSGNIGDKNSPQNGMYQILEKPMRIPNIWPVQNAEGKYIKPSMSENPVADLLYGGYAKDKSASFNGNLALEYSPAYIKGLTMKVLGVFDYSASHSKTWTQPYELWQIVDRTSGTYQEVIPTTKPGLSERANFSSTRQLEFHANYKTTIADHHNISALYVFNVAEWDNNYLNGSRINYASTAIDQLFAGPSDGQSTGGSAGEGARMGHVGRVTYDYMGKYMFEANCRYDGSMKFAKDKRWGFFPSFSAGWRLSEEGFIKNNFNFVNNLKLRASWGQAGNDRVSDFQYLASYAMQGTPYSFGGTAAQTAKESRLPNPDITWETAVLTDVGLEGTLWKGLLSFEADYFFKRTRDILRPTQKTSSIIGISLPDSNIGIVENHGFEFMLGHRNTINDFTYSANFNFTYATNKAVELGEAEGTLNDPFRRQTGLPLNSYFGYISEGLFTSEAEIASWANQGGGIAPGDIKYRDFSGPEGKPDGKIDSYDQTKIGYSSVPEIIYGLNLNAAWKGFDLSMSFQGAGHVNYIYSSWGAFAFYNGGNIQKWMMRERWTTENNNANARYPRMQTSPSANNMLQSDYWMRDGSYVRLKNVQLGYNIPKSVLSHVNLSALRLYVSAQNLFTWTKDKLLTTDPEAGDSRGTYYPQTKVVTMGLNLTF